MHTSSSVHTSEFRFERNGTTVSFDRIVPEFSVRDRIGVVVTSPGGGFVAAPLVLACVGRYYEHLADHGESFYSYPDYYVVHVGRHHGHHGWIDVWPEHKEVVVDADPEAVLRALNDRAVTRVLLQDTAPSPRTLFRETVASTIDRVTQSFVFGSDMVREEDSVVVTASEAAVRHTRAAIHSSGSLLGTELAARLLADADRPHVATEIPVHEAIRRICGMGPVDPHFRLSAPYRSAHGVDASSLDRHSVQID